MTNQHPITPPPELVQQWINEGDGFTEGHFATQAARWGADQQLAQDAKWLNHNALNAPHLQIIPVGESLKEAMRPKPPSLKEQALEELGNAYDKEKIDDTTYDIIRHALDALPND